MIRDRWRAAAACTPSHHADFFPPGLPDLTHRPTDRPLRSVRVAVARAREICARCPVRDDCLAWALDHHEPAGVWGGLTPNERRPLLRARRTTTRQLAAAHTRQETR